MLFGPIDFLASGIVQSFASPALDYLFRGISFLGNPVFWLGVAALAYWVGEEKKSLSLMNLLLISSVAVSAIKNIFSIPRPSGIRVVEENVLPSVFAYNDSNDYSFPSGHSAISASLFGHSAKYFNGFLHLLLLAIPFAVALSRIYLGKHFLSDVLAGLILGFAIAIINEKISRRIEKYEFGTGKISNEIMAVLLIMGAITVILLADEPIIILGVMGFYAGFFISKDLRIRQKKTFGRERNAKLGLGIITLLILVLGASIEPAFAPVIAFLAGTWITLGYPAVFNKMS